MTPALAPALVIAVILAIDLWVYFDAKGRVEKGAPVEFRIGTLVIDTPAIWFLGCLVLWVIVFPIYLVSRGQ